MLAIEVEYLLGRAVATDTSQRDRAEWPPHPTRLFSALVDALHDITDDGDRARADAALRWIEAQPPPAIRASLDDDASARSVVKHFVPINDEPVDPKNVRATPLTELRTRQERFFPAVVPAEPTVVFSWPGAEPSEAHLTALRDLTARIPYLGHSSSVVRVACTTVAMAPVIAPALAGEFLLRVPGTGRLDRLNAVHGVRRTDTYAQPPRGKEVRYARIGEEEMPRGPHGAIRVVAFDGARFGLTETAWVTSRFREAFISKLPHARTAPEALSGHAPDGAPARRPHLAIVPLANVGYVHGRFADGSIKGLGVLVPRDLDESALRMLDVALSGVQTLVFGQRGEVETSLLSDGEDGRVGPRLRSLDATRYQGAASTWVSVTPIALGLHPKAKLSEEDIVAKHVLELGLPAPASVSLHNVSEMYGAPPAKTFHRGDVTAVKGRVLRHAVLRFSEKIAGPLVVGAGRHMGFGLFLPRGDAS